MFVTPVAGDLDLASSGSCPYVVHIKSCKHTCIIEIKEVFKRKKLGPWQTEDLGVCAARTPTVVTVY